MRIKSGNTSTYLYFEARDTTDLVTPENGLATKLRAKRSRNGGALTAFTTPTFAAIDTGTGGYALLMDEDTTVAAGAISEEMRVRITDTGGRMEPVVRVVELYRGDVEALYGDTGDAKHLQQFAQRLSATGYIDTGTVDGLDGIRADIRAVIGDTGAAHGRMAAVLDTGKVASAVWTSHVNRQVLDTGIADQVWKWGDTGTRMVNVRKLHGDTGASNHLRQAMASDLIGGYIRADVGLVHGDTGAARHLEEATAASSVIQANVDRIDNDTGAANHLREFTDALSSGGYLDTGTYAGGGPMTLATTLDGLKLAHHFRLYSAVLGGVVSGAGTGTELFKKIGDSAVTRVTATVDSSGNRSALTLDLDT
jgi:hypothetical protein